MYIVACYRNTATEPKESGRKRSAWPGIFGRSCRVTTGNAVVNGVFLTDENRGQGASVRKCDRASANVRMVQRAANYMLRRLCVASLRRRERCIAGQCQQQRDATQYSNTKPPDMAGNIKLILHS